MSSMPTQSEIDVKVWPFVEDFNRAMQDRSTTVENGKRRVPVVALEAMRERYHKWKAAHEQLWTLYDESTFKPDREAALEAEIDFLEADLVAKWTMSSDVNAGKWQKEYDKHQDMTVKWGKWYDAVNKLVLKIL
ncbi:hypothetical protein FN846DRAFT_896055 [Sphaerosporella brunnea]|uniref:Uncharacterized protein n=1 Tax=Sphaerosporella brunnea TaxID=1250544 RepID=A0A5J5EE51_9PEZI|nr:hypothetical protein FN846DRAFT_896055 [Sphaerosporella brunnea]